jgi:hypothetical protein
VRAVSSKSSPEAAEDSVELRSVSTDMAVPPAGGVGRSWWRVGFGLSFGSPVTSGGRLSVSFSARWGGEE